MKKRIYALALSLAVLLPGAALVNAASPRPLSTIQAVHALTNQQAAEALPVDFEATVTYYERGNIDLFVQDRDTAIYVQTGSGDNLQPGDHVRVVGHTHPSFRPEIIADRVDVLGHDVLPAPVTPTYRQLIHAEFDCRRVTVHAVVRSVNIITNAGIKDLNFQLLMDGGLFEAETRAPDNINLDPYLDSEVDVSGASAGVFDSKNQMTGILIEVPSLADVRIRKLAQTSPEALPFTPMDEILQGYNILDRKLRTRVQGIVTYYQPGSAAVLQNGDKSLWISTQYQGPLRLGDLAEATGFPGVQRGALALSQANMRDTGVAQPISPVAVTAADLLAGTHAYELITLDAKLVSSMREPAQDEFVLSADNHLFTAIYPHPSSSIDPRLPHINNAPINSVVRVTGIAIVDNGDRFQGPQAFDLLLRSPLDVTVIASPSAVNVTNLILLIIILLFVVSALGVRAWVTERRVRRQTSELAYVERRRSRILENVNGSVPLPDIIDQITELVSFMLRGMPCWCLLADGASLGNRPTDLTGFRIVEVPILGRPGDRLGTLAAAFHRLTKPRPSEEETLTMAAGLVAVAIENRRLFSDLRHRSEFDLLTDIHNRFSFDRALDQLLDDARKTGSIFGLIYVDLDNFKGVNDVYGHHFGDIFLQNVTLRMKHQLRPVDLLARLGGDEFAILIPNVTSHTDVEEVAQRLTHGFEQPFSLDGHEIHGAASFGLALYPTDGVTKDSLLNAADAAMYVSKHATRARSAANPSANPRPEPPLRHNP